MKPRLILYFGLAGVGVMLLMFVASCVVIGRGVRERCEGAREKYGGDCVGALVELVEDENATYGERNSGIWALGQLGDERALETLEKLYTGEIPDREPWEGTLSQYELKKALRLVRGGFNASAWVWRRGEGSGRDSILP